VNSLSYQLTVFIICSQRGTTILVLVCTSLYPLVEKVPPDSTDLSDFNRGRIICNLDLGCLGISSRISDVKQLIPKTSPQRQAVPSIGSISTIFPNPLYQRETLYTTLPYIRARPLMVGLRPMGLSA